MWTRCDCHGHGTWYACEMGFRASVRYENKKKIKKRSLIVSEYLLKTSVLTLILSASLNQPHSAMITRLKVHPGESYPSFNCLKLPRVQLNSLLNRMIFHCTYLLSPTILSGSCKIFSLKIYSDPRLSTPLAWRDWGQSEQEQLCDQALATTPAFWSRVQLCLSTCQ